jgi:hypothetical protein
MFDLFSHYLSYGATDQQTARQLSNYYDGLLVPGTVAAFQAEGTRGFVLTLSAANRATRYIIDSRFPLFQQRLPSPKKSHLALAKCLGDEDLVQSSNPDPVSFDEGRVRNIAANWIEFNGGYNSVSNKAFAKYAERLGEVVVAEDSSGPENVLPPYFVANGPDDPWWDVSVRLWQASLAQTEKKNLVRVVAAQSAAALGPLLSDIADDYAAIWVSDLNELDVSFLGLEALVDYGKAIKSASDRSNLFALYGGFFSVLLGQFGLSGSSHGIGYGESRNWVELPSSGPPPARYYLPRAHRYISQDLALLFWRNNRDLVVCACEECQSGSPARLDYQGLMRHSVRCRQLEINTWGPMATLDAANHLENDARAFEAAIGEMDIPRKLRAQADRSFVHLDGWARSVRRIASKLT